MLSLLNPAASPRHLPAAGAKTAISPIKRPLRGLPAGEAAC